MFIRHKPEPLKALGLIILLTCLVFASWALLHRTPMPAKDVYPYLLGISPELVEECNQDIQANRTAAWEDILAIRSTLSAEASRTLIAQLEHKSAFSKLEWGDIPGRTVKTISRRRDILIRYPFLSPGVYSFPVIGPTWFTDTFGAGREGGKRTHQGTDLFSPEGTAIISVCGGKVEQLGWNRLGGERVGVRGDDGNYYYYAHLQTIASQLAKGKRVETGQEIGTMGHTGDAITTPDHLHFGIELPNGEWLNPYPFLAVWQYWAQERMLAQ